MTTLEALIDTLKKMEEKMEEQNNRLERIRSGKSLKLIVCTGKRTTSKFDLRKYNKIVV